MQEDSDFLQCYICLQGVKRARMCPQCSKLACFECLRIWMEDHRSECPHCRQPVPLTSFADCQRFIDDLANVFKKIDKIQRPKKLCEEHGMELIYYCGDCSVAFCSDCGMFNNSHKQHAVTRLSKLYEQKRNRILSQMTRFDRKIEQYKRNGMSIKLSLQKLHLTMQQKKGYIGDYFSNFLQKLQLEFKQKQSTVLQKFKSNQQQIQLLQSLKQTIVQDLQGYSQKQFIDHTNQIMNLVDSLCGRRVEEVELDPTFTTIYQLVPSYTEFTYEMKGYGGLGEGVLYSQAENVNGVEWRLKVYPRGNGKARGQWLSVFLEMSQGYQNDVKYEYKIQLLNYLNKSDTIIKQYSSKFDVGQCWGYNQFLQLTSLPNGYLIADTLTFKFSLRKPNYKQQCLDQKRYVDRLEAKVKELERLVYEHSYSRVEGSNNGGGSSKGMILKERRQEEEEENRRREFFRKFVVVKGSSQNHQVEEHENQEEVQEKQNHPDNDEDYE